MVLLLNKKEQLLDGIQIKISTKNVGFKFDRWNRSFHDFQT